MYFSYTKHTILPKEVAIIGFFLPTLQIFLEEAEYNNFPEIKQPPSIWGYSLWKCLSILTVSQWFIWFDSIYFSTVIYDLHQCLQRFFQSDHSIHVNFSTLQIQNIFQTGKCPNSTIKFNWMTLVFLTKLCNILIFRTNSIHFEWICLYNITTTSVYAWFFAIWVNELILSVIHSSWVLLSRIT